MFASVFALAVAAQPGPAEVPFLATAAGDERPKGKLVRLTPDFAATIDTPTGAVEATGLVSLRRDKPLPPFPTRPHLVTAEGDRIVGELVGGDARSVRFAPSAAALKGESWSVPLASAAAIWFVEPPADTPVDPAKYPWWGEGTKNRDVVRFRNGDTARGILVGLSPKAARPTLQFRPDGGATKPLAVKEVAAVAFNPALARPKKPAGAYARVVLADGSRLALTGPAIDRGVLTGETLFGQKVVLPLDAVVALDVLQGKATYLSDLKPKKVEQGGFLGVVWPWAADRGVDGSPLKLLVAGGDSTFDKGLGTRPRTVLAYDLGGKYRRFEALAGLNPDAGGRGAAKVRVLLDGKAHAVGPAGRPLTAGKAVAVSLDVTGAKELVLEVDFGLSGSVEADVNWADARVVE